MSAASSSALVTIGITCFNAEDTIARAIGSALAQDWANFEVIIVDDKSSDGSIARVKKAIAGSERVRLVCHHRNLGPAGARNTILATAKGEFVAFFDDDDEALSTRLSGQIQTLTAFEQSMGTRLVLCYGSGERRYPNGYSKSLAAIGSRGEVPHGSGVADYLLFYRRRSGWFFGSGTPACSLLARRSVLAGGFDVRFRRAEDVDLAIGLALKGAYFTGTSKSVFVQYATDASDKSAQSNLKAELQLVDKYAAYLKSIGQYYHAKQWPKLRYWHFKRRYARFALELMLLLARHPLAVPTHLLKTGPQRLFHEKRMRDGYKTCG